MNKNISIRFIALVSLLLTIAIASAQNEPRAHGVPVIPKPVNTVIAGAPLLGRPQLIMGSQQDIRTEKHGLAYPTLYDWNGDGKLDLLIGEFETGETGSNIKIYLNEGTKKKPRYSGKYFYAKDIKGDTITNYQWCCIGIHPRLVDINGDGYLDILSGQYNPGQVSLWAGSKDGFQPRMFVEQEGYKEGHMNENYDASDPRSNDYWNYTSASFSDFNGDGLFDMFVGGFGELRVALNIGTKEHPKFGLRKNILGIDGYPISVIKPNKEQIDVAFANYRSPQYAGVYKSFITPIDWDGDGVLDLLVTHLYGNKKTKDPVVFFRGVQTDKGLRFEDAKTLFTLPNADKTFPGCQPNISVADYNNDGVKDLLIGISIPTVNGFEVDSLIAWGYLNDFGIESPGKDAGLAIAWSGGLDSLKLKIASDPFLKDYYMGKLTDEKYLTLRHRGFVYVMLGEKNKTKATPVQGVIAHEEILPPNNEVTRQGAQGPVSYDVKSPATIRPFDTFDIEVIVTFKEDWYGYANTEGNLKAGWIPTVINLKLPKGFERVGSLQSPASHHKGPSDVYTGKVSFVQRVRIVDTDMHIGKYTVAVNLQYQTCNSQQCLPPEEAQIDLSINYSK